MDMTLDLPIDTTRLLERCAVHARAGRRDPADDALLRRWQRGAPPRIAALARQLLRIQPRDWDAAIRAHRAYRHPWHDTVRERIGTDALAATLLENPHAPAFVPMLRRIREVLITADSIAAIDETIAAEHHPLPHADLASTMLRAVAARARPDLRLASRPKRVDRTLVHYHGWFCDPWHLVGSLFASERLTMATHGLAGMEEALRRMGLDDEALMFVAVHSRCDHRHAEDWLARIVLPSIRADTRTAAPMAAGIAACLETSADDLDDLHDRHHLHGPIT